MPAQRIVIVIPARYASVRFPGKPLADIAGKTMIQRVWEQCSLSTLANRVLVATDDQRIADEVMRFGGEFVMTPPELNSGSARVAFAANQVEGDIFVNVQGDEPLMPPATIDAAITPLLSDPAIDIGTAACSLSSHMDIANPNIVKIACTAEGRALYFSRSPIPSHRDEPYSTEGYLKHIGIYAFRRAALLRFFDLPESPLERIERLEQLRALEAGMHIHVAMVDADSVAVDTPEDINRVLEAMER